MPIFSNLTGNVKTAPPRPLRVLDKLGTIPGPKDQELQADRKQFSKPTRPLRVLDNFGTISGPKDQEIQAKRKQFSRGKKTVAKHAVADSLRNSVASDVLSSNTDTAQTGGNPTVAKGADDGDSDGNGDSDPDSDRKELFQQSKSARVAPVQSAKSNCILRMPALKVRIGLSRSTIYEAISKGEFPVPISLGPRAVGWLESDVDEWLDNRISVSKVEVGDRSQRAAMSKSTGASKRFLVVSELCFSTENDDDEKMQSLSRMGEASE